MAEVAIILDNVGNNVYAQTAREFLVSPIRADMVRVLLNKASQLNNIVKIRNQKSFGGEWNRDISLQNYIKSSDKTNLIIDITLDPPLVIDGQTFFQMDIEANSEIDLMFYFDQAESGKLLT